MRFDRSTFASLLVIPLSFFAFSAQATPVSGVAQPITFDLTYISPSMGTLASCGSSTLGAECTPAGSPFTLFQLSSNTVIASLQLNGNSYMGSFATGTSYTTSIFSTQTALNGTIPQIIAQLTNGGDITGVTYYSASFTAAPVPAPTSLLLMGLGLVGVGVVLRRKTVKN